MSPRLTQQVSECSRAPGSPTLTVSDSKATSEDAGPLGSTTASLVESDLAGLALRFSPPTSWGSSSGLPEVSNSSPLGCSFANKKCV